MTECQGCGAWNERHRTFCVLCGTPLAETDEWDAAAELPPLPPLPDGGLSATMPAWLRSVPGTTQPLEPPEPVFSATSTREEERASLRAAPGPSAHDADAAAVDDSSEPAPADAVPADLPLGPQADPRTFLRDEDFPRWIRELPALPPRPIVHVTVTAAHQGEVPAPPAPPVELAALPVQHPEPVPSTQETPGEELDVVGAQAPEPPLSVAATPEADPGTGARIREPWETSLLVVLVVGIVAAVIWALLVNGLIGSGL